MSFQLSHDEFHRTVEEALGELPERFRDLLTNIAIVVEEEPGELDLEVTEDEDEGGELLGIYRGVPLTERSFESPPELPDQIAIFRGPILRVCSSRAEALEEIRDTVIHELGHYFGLADHEMDY